MKTRRIVSLLTLLCFSLFAIDPHGGTKTVTTAGTAVRLVAASTPAVSFTVRAKTANTGLICIGASDVLAASQNGRCITAGMSAPYYAVTGQTWDLTNVWIDSSVSGEGVGFDYGY